MSAFRLCVIALLLTPTLLGGQSTRPFAYRGFRPGMTYTDFAERARALAHNDVLTCQTMRSTAQVMDCGVRARDPADSDDFYLSANVIDGRTSVISLMDSGGVALVKRIQDDMRRQLGPTQRRGRGIWEWTSGRGRRFIRFNWRGRANWRVISITLNDRDVMDRIRRYRPAPKKRTP